MRKSVFVFHPPPQDIRSLPPQQLGSHSAIHGMASTLRRCAGEAFDVKWCHNVHSAGWGRAYFYAETVKEPRDDECGLGSIPYLLNNNKVDLLLHFHPELHGALVSRGLWARRAVPVVGMLHSINYNFQVTDLVMQNLGAASYPFDTMISPTLCGIQAFQGMMDEVNAWMRPKMPHWRGYQGRLEMVPYGIDGEFFGQVDKQEARAKLGLPQDAVVWLSVGRFSQREKADLLPLLLATQMVRARGQNVVLFLVGAGSDYVDRVKQSVADLQLEKAVDIRVGLPADVKLMAYAACDIYVAVGDSIQETYGLTLLEAMAAGKPVVAAAWNGYREIVVDHVTGMLVPTYTAPIPPMCEIMQSMIEGPRGNGHLDLNEATSIDPMALAQHLELLSRDAELRQRMGEAGRRHQQQKHDLEKNMRQIIALLTDLMLEAQNRPWEAPQGHDPFVSKVAKRFFHYHSAGLLPDHAVLAVASPDEAAARTRVMASHLNIRDAFEMGFVDAVLQFVAPKKQATVAEVLLHLASRGYPRDYCLPRLVRCLKYAIVTTEQFWDAQPPRAKPAMRR